MQKRANSQVSAYKTLFAPLPCAEGEPLYFDQKPVGLPTTRDFAVLHYHDRYEIGLCVHGDGLVLREGVYASLSAGDVTFAAPRARHYSRSLDEKDPCRCRFVYVQREALHSLFAGTELAAQAEKTAGAVPPVLRAAEYPVATRTLAEIVLSCGETREALPHTVPWRLAAFLAESGKLFAENEPLKEAHGTDAMEALAEYLSVRYEGKETAARLAEMWHLSESQLRRRFIAVYGMPPIAYRNAARLRVGRELLKRTDLAISTIAERVGYGDISEFYRAFHKEYGMAPGVLRRQGEERKNKEKATK